MIFGHVIISDHAIDRYKERVLPRKARVKKADEGNIHRMILKELSFRNMKEIVNFGDEYKFVFTNNNCEYRFERSRNNKSWVLLTVLKYKKIFAFEESYTTLEEYMKLSSREKREVAGMNTAIAIRKEQKEKYENGWCVDGNNLVRDFISN